VVKGLKIRLILTFVFFCITSLFLFISESIPNSIDYKEASKEIFDPQLQRLNNVGDIIRYTDSMYVSLKLGRFDTSRYVKIVSGTIKRRFYHGISHYSLSDNWIVFVLGRICWDHMSAIVKPDDILKYPEGLCSQQNIVFMQVLNEKGITTRSVGLGRVEGPGHFLCEVQYDNRWHLYDVDVEPNWERTTFDHESLDILLSNKNELYKIYEGRLTTDVIDKVVSIVNYGLPNEFPAKNMLLFHKVTKLLTYFLPIFFAIMFILFYRKYKLGR
jgi:hypothetical protein